MGHASRIPEGNPKNKERVDGRRPGRYHPAMPPEPPARARAVHALLDDLLIRARIESTAAAAGIPLIVSANPAELRERLGAGAGGVLVDLALPGAAEAIAALRRQPVPPRVVAWGSHVDVDAMDAARAAGADRVLPRSAFTRRLPEILRELSGG